MLRSRIHASAKELRQKSKRNSKIIFALALDSNWNINWASRFRGDFGGEPDVGRDEAVVHSSHP
jgi:hypothetical protein